MVGLWTALSPRSGAFLKRKWANELDYRLKKELSGFRENRMAVRFEYEWHDTTGQWFRSYGNELWQFNEDGLMSHRYASINDLPIEDAGRYLNKKTTEAVPL